MVAKPPGGRPGMVGDELAPPVGTPAFLLLPAALPALSWLSTAALLPAPPESLRLAELGLSLIAPPGRGTPAPACLATSPCRAAAPPAHARLVCFVCCCMMSLLFVHTCYLLRASPLPAISRIGSKSPLSHTFHEHSRVARLPDSLLPSDATRAACEPFLWCHPRKQNGHECHLVATKVGAVVFATSGRIDVACGWGMEPNAHDCRSSDRAGLCCVHRPGRGRGGRREGA